MADTSIKTNPAPTPIAAGSDVQEPKRGKIHPVVIYPFLHPSDHADLEELYRLIAQMDADKEACARPITVMDRKTYDGARWNKSFLDFRSKVVAQHSEIVDAWCVDTCQMWYTGLGAASEQGSSKDVYWLIPGDFNYGAPEGKAVLGNLRKLPEMVLNQQQDLCIGEVAFDVNSSKHLIDTYGTWALLYNWFPQQTLELRKMTDRPRSEFFAIRHGFLQEVLHQRWYAYEQTTVLLLHSLARRSKLGRLALGDITDLPQRQETVAAAMQQVERMERVLKLVWREWHQQESDWIERFQALEAGSEQVRRAAMVLLIKLLR
jgi:hypothetical protein